MDLDLKSKRTRVLAIPAIDEALANWVLQCQAKRVMLSGDLIKARESLFSTLNGIREDQLLLFLNGWLQSFQARHDFKQLSAYSESGSVNSKKIPAQGDAIREHLTGASLAKHLQRGRNRTSLLPCDDKTIAQ
uniref:HTH CENPB-type domain-containing protein n=1 Tax=Peronospora matthiolae TaxID=2874970 RepID=A0AAV1V2S9_9STRA